MKKIFYIFVASLAMMLTACDTEAVSGLDGNFADIQRCNFSQASVQPTSKLKKGIKALNVSFSNEAGQKTSLAFGSKEWILGQGTYVAQTSVSADKQCAGSLDGKQIKSGTIDVSLVDSSYYINGLVTLTDGTKSVINYKGALKFVVGVDDPEASGYTFTLTQSPVSVFDMTTFTSTDYPNVTKYIVKVSDPSGKAVAEFDAVNGNNLQSEALKGAYTVASGAHDALTVEAGYAVPEYNAFGGSFYTDDNGVVQYITAGTITIETAKDAEGTTLYTFTGKDLATVKADASTGTGTFKITFASLTK